MEYEKKYRDEDLPKVSVIIPTVNAAQLISMTLEQILAQDYPRLEVIIIDSSTDRTLEYIKHFRSDKVRIYSVSECTRFEMVNRGLSQSRGEYVNILFPGDYYIHRGTLRYMMTLALSEKQPELVYCATLLREGDLEPKILFRDFNLNVLRRGQQPTSLQACWLRADALRKLGKFGSEYYWRGGFELMCRMAEQENMRIVGTKRVLIDFDLRSIKRRMVMAHFWETMKTVYRHFGMRAAMRWLWKQDDALRFMHLWMRSLKIAFSGTKGIRR